MFPIMHRLSGAAPWLLAAAAVLLATRAPADEGWPPAPPLARAPEETPGSLPASIQARPTDDGRWQVTFRYRVSPGEAAPRSMSLAGSFNGWNRDANAMTTGDDGAWSATVTLADAVYEYKFVRDRETWLRDPVNPDGADDNHGGQNSMLRLGRLAQLRESPGRPGDGQVDVLGIEHVPDRALYFQPVSDRAVQVRLRMFAHDVERVSCAPRAAPPVEMRLIHEDAIFALYEAEVPFTPNSDRAAGRDFYEYTFVFEDGATRASTPETFQATSGRDAIFTTPDWAKNAVWYQIMVDRFRNGDPRNDPANVRPWTSEWFTPSPWEEQNGQTFYKNFVFKRLYGGDIAGLEQALPYLQDLGVTALYLNPVFKAESHHKYDATNYLHIDDHFGVRGDYDAVAAGEDLSDPATWKWTDSDKLFLAFIQKAHAAGIRVVIDGVWNHVGVPHPAFQDVVARGRDSKYADWFDVVSWEPFKYNGWAGHDSLPVFKKSATGFASDGVKQHLFNVTRRWMDPNGDGDPRDGIDGWRLDVPSEVALPFWAEWRALVKSINPDAYLTGEIWDRADQWLDGRHFDAVMNYEFARAAVGWICHDRKKLRPSEIDRKFRELRLAYPLAATQVMMNLVDSHDTDRLVSMALNPDRVYDKENRVQDDNPNYDNGKPQTEHYARARLVALLQMTYVGAPMIYYGNEAGMWGADDPTCRKPMLWKDREPYDKPDENCVIAEHLDWHKRVIALRHAHPALRTGAFTTLKADDAADVWVFARSHADETLIVALNASGETKTTVVPLPRGYASAWTPVFGPEDAATAARGELTLRIPPWNGIVLKAGQ